MSYTSETNGVKFHLTPSKEDPESVLIRIEGEIQVEDVDNPNCLLDYNLIGKKVFLFETTVSNRNKISTILRRRAVKAVMYKNDKGIFTVRDSYCENIKFSNTPQLPDDLKQEATG